MYGICLSLSDLFHSVQKNLDLNYESLLLEKIILELPGGSNTFSEC